MAGKTLPFKKRSNPLEGEISEKVENLTENKPIFAENAEQTRPKPVKNVRNYEGMDANREKYTATMDKNLRRRLKIAAVNHGLQLSSYIEEACREKLDRDGF